MFRWGSELSIHLAFTFSLGLAVVLWIVPTNSSTAQSWNWSSCIQTAEEDVENENVGFSLAPPVAEKIVSEISDTIGLDRPVKIVPCNYMNEIAVVPPFQDNSNEFILVNSNRLSIVLDGDTPEQAQFVVAHELAHILNADFSSRKSGTSRRIKEDRADLFAACAVARLRGNWSSLDQFLKRLRSVDHEDYSLYDGVIGAIKKRFDSCSNSSPYVEPTVNTSIDLQLVISQLDEAVSKCKTDPSVRPSESGQFSGLIRNNVNSGYDLECDQSNCVVKNTVIYERRRPSASEYRSHRDHYVSEFSLSDVNVSYKGRAFRFSCKTGYCIDTVVSDWEPGIRKDQRASWNSISLTFTNLQCPKLLTSYAGTLAYYAK